MTFEPLRILVVEDDPTDFAFVRKAFNASATPVELFHCQDADQAISALDERACRIVLLDLMLNGEDGLGVLKAIRGHERFNAVPVVILSSSASRADIDASYRAGANAYVEKPLSIDAYRTFANAFAQFWGSIARLA